MRQQDKLVHENEDGSGLSKHMLQMMEQVVKFAKKQCRTNCNHKEYWMKRLFEFLDCLTIGSVGYNLVDFKKCKIQYEKNKKLIYDKYETPQLEQRILSEMPQYWYLKWQQVHSLKFGQKIPTAMKKEWNQHVNDDQYDQLHQNDDNVEFSYMNMDDVETNDGESSQSSGFDTGMRNLSMQQLSQHMLQQTMDQSQSQLLTGIFNTQSDEQSQNYSSSSDDNH